VNGWERKGRGNCVLTGNCLMGLVKVWERKGRKVIRGIVC